MTGTSKVLRASSMVGVTWTGRETAHPSPLVQQCDVLGKTYWMPHGRGETGETDLYLAGRAPPESRGAGKLFGTKVMPEFQ